MTAKPRLSFWQIWNMSFGFLGIQFGFALQGGFMSRIRLWLRGEIVDAKCHLGGMNPGDGKTHHG